MESNSFFNGFTGEPSWQELVEFIAGGAQESQRIEFKSQFYGSGGNENAELAKDLSALANTEGGLILFGINEVAKDDTGELCPIQIDETFDARMRQVISSTVSPHLPFSCWWLRSEPDGTNGVMVVHVPRSPFAPHAISQSKELSYPVRRGTTTAYLREPELARAYELRIMSGNQEKNWSPT